MTDRFILFSLSFSEASIAKQFHVLFPVEFFFNHFQPTLRPIFFFMHQWRSVKILYSIEISHPLPLLGVISFSCPAITGQLVKR